MYSNLNLFIDITHLEQKLRVQASEWEDLEKDLIEDGRVLKQQIEECEDEMEHLFGNFSVKKFS